MPELLELPVSVCVVDDASPDGTGDLADGFARDNMRVTVIHRSGKLGLGTAYVAGFKQALANGADAVLTMDADFSHHPRYIPSMMAAIEHADLVIGSRYVPGGSVLYPLHRRVLSRVANMVARMALGLNARDCTAGFRLYRASVLKNAPIERIKSNGYSFLVEMLQAISRQNIRIVEVPIIFADRIRGESKISPHEIYKGMRTVARLALKGAK